MSYPDLGCFAECLTCELCETGFDPPSNPDLFPSEWPGDDPFGLNDWAPPEESGGSLFDDFDMPGIGDLDILPMNPFKGEFGITISGEF